MSYRVVAQRPGQYLATADSVDEPNAMGRIIDSTTHETVDVSFHAALARGYWEPFSGTSAEGQRVLTGAPWVAVERITPAPQIVVLRADTTPDDRKVERLIAVGGAAIAALAERLRNGTITKQEFLTQAQQVLSSHLTQAAAVGAGTSIDPPDALVDTDMGDFADDVDAADSDAGTGVSAAQAAQRAALWASLAWAAYQWGKTRADDTPADTLWQWTLDPDPGVKHCTDCKDNAANGPYTRDEIPSYPGDGATTCASNCRCSLDPVES